MINIVDKTKCCGCGSCAQKCNTDAIRMIADEEGFLYPHIDINLCVGCDICDKVCPVQLADTSNIEMLNLAYAVRTKDEKVLQQSTSGGISYELARFVLNNNGIVVGACYNNDFSVVHKMIYSEDELHSIQGSKYVQSDIGTTYNETKELLDKGKTVLFTGTPCQIEGLLAYLGKQYENLITLDIICHGVPSPGLWGKYILENHFDTAEDIVFRDKTKGWETKPEFVVKWKDHEKRSSFYQTPYTFFFLENYSLRPICFCCPFKTGYKKSDLTCADLWGIDTLLANEEHDDKGWSLLLVHSPKGKNLLDNILKRVESRAISYDEAVANNLMMIRSVKDQEGRSDFFKEIQHTSFKKLYKKYKPKDPPVLAVKKKLYPLKMMIMGKK